MTATCLLGQIDCQASKASDGWFHQHSGGVAPTWTLHLYGLHNSLFDSTGANPQHRPPPISERKNVKIIITLQDDEAGAVQVEEVRYVSPGEHAEAVTAASALAEEMLGILDELGDTEAVSEVC
jgi:hypothetical protein